MDHSKRVGPALTEQALGSGGAVHILKDERMPAAVFRQSYTDWQRFAEQVDPGFSADVWRRAAA